MDESGDQNYDGKKFTICAPWYGNAGPAYMRVFRPAFMAGLRGKGDDFGTLYDHLRGDVPGGVLPPTAAELAADPDHLNALHDEGPSVAERRKEKRAFKSRDNMIIAHVRKHIPVPSIQSAIDSLVKLGESKDYDNRAVVLEMPIVAGIHTYPPGHANAGAQVADARDIANWQK